MPVFDDAIFDLTPSDVTVYSDHSSMVTDGWAFLDAPIATYQPINTGNIYASELGWTFLPGTDVGTVYEAAAVNPPNFNTEYGNTFFTLHLGTTVTADPSNPPTNFLAGIELGVFPVTPGLNYFL